jgi:hypothetical protein
MASTLFDDTVRIATRFAHEVEPRPWGFAGHTLELAKQVGALAACVLIREGYKPGEVHTATLQDETSDVLFMLFRIGHLLGITLSLQEGIQTQTTPVEPLMLTLIQGTGALRALCPSASQDVPQEPVRTHLDTMVHAVAQVAAYYGFQLEQAHRVELQRAEAWLDLRRQPWWRRLYPIVQRLAPVLRRWV